MFGIPGKAAVTLTPPAAKAIVRLMLLQRARRGERGYLVTPAIGECREPVQQHDRGARTGFMDRQFNAVGRDPARWRRPEESHAARPLRKSASATPPRFARFSSTPLRMRSSSVGTFRGDGIPDFLEAVN